MLKIDRTDKSVFGKWWWTTDRWLISAILILSFAGIFLVMAASPAVAERLGRPPFFFVIRHVIFLTISLTSMFFISFLSPRNIWRLGLVLLISSIFMIILTLIFGSHIKGSSRWLHIFGFSVQPSEFVKPAFAVVSAWLISKQQYSREFKGMIATITIYAIIVILLLLQPDFGMSFVLSCILGAQIFIAGIPLSIIFGLIVMASLGIFGLYNIFPHIQSRIDRFIDPNSGDNYQVQKSLDSFHNGGLFGVGPGDGKVKMSLPDAHADFIFSVAGEEFGLILTLALIAVLGFIIFRMLYRSWRSQDIFKILAIGGIATQFTVQSLIHMGSSLQLLPAKGITLPFISYGGSSILSLGIALGIVLALGRKDVFASSNFQKEQSTITDYHIKNSPTIKPVSNFFR